MRINYRKINSSKVFKLFILLLLVIFGFAGYQAVRRPASLKKTASEPRVIPAKSTVEIGKSFVFPAPKIGKKGEEDVTFTIAYAELKDEITVKGNPRKATKGNQFLLLRLEIENKAPDRLSLIPSDYIRLVSEEGKNFSPDFHNAAIIIDPLSVRKDLVSFIVGQDEKKFTFMVGELEEEEKEKVEINF